MLRSASCSFRACHDCGAGRRCDLFRHAWRRRPASRFVARDITWNCGAAACQGATDESRPLVLCQSLAKRAGRIDSFLVDGRALAAAELDEVQRRSPRPQPAKALAAQ